ncbi:hypothetical protein A2Z00_05415 [Candidatus Gottesmanbacteria bacterium RBG_13_45_10]|uniref:M23ase beta-sheet core domain-containing protein n=1 Tax=Candidatus Gottesmanbacteria bacterium RBG_13_45_10 TaxID=1798370 RepID=A0A1F5ZHB3_9BACT|nr:MAG: hypothetical protein A2Z00_05415 [Candidatus Gottesmanbacteria bacterium RBG_13_45_10]
MATEPETIEEFFKRKNIESIIRGGKNKELEALFLEFSQCFPDHSKPQEILNAATQEELEREIVKFFERLNPEQALPQIKGERSTLSPNTLQGVPIITEQFRAASKHAEEELVTRGAHAKTLRETYVHRLLDNWLLRSQEQIQDAKTLEEAQRLSQPATGDIDTLEKTRQYLDKVARDKRFAQQREILENASQQEEYNGIAQMDQSNKRAEEVFFEVQKGVISQKNPPPRLDILFSEAIKQSDENPTKLASAVADGAMATARIASVMSSDVPERLPVDGLEFLGAIAQGPAENALKIPAGLIFNRLNPEQQLMVVRGVFERSLARIEGVTQPTGEFLAASSWLKEVLRTENQAAAQKAAGTALATGVGKVVDDVFGAFRGVSPETIERMNAAWANVSSRGVAGPGGTAIPPRLPNTGTLSMAFLYMHSPESFTFAPNVNRGWALARIAGSAAKSGVTTLAKKGLSNLLGKLFGGAIGTALGGPGIGTALGGALLGKIIEKAGSLLGKVANFLSFGALGALFGKESSREAALIIIVTICAVIGLIINPLQLAENAKSADLAINIGGGGSNFPQYPNIPFQNSNITACPVQNHNYSITQCPGNPGDTHRILYAYDIGIPNGTPIYPTHDGVVVYASWSTAGYGNLVIVKGTTPSPESKDYYTYYGHFGTGSIFVSVGENVTAGVTVLGLSDNTGNSTGPHLHYEWRPASNEPAKHYDVQFLLPSCNYPGQSQCAP